MVFPARWVAAVGVLSLLILVGSVDQATGQDTSIKLDFPLDTNEPILSLAYEGGFRMPPEPGFQPTPLVSLYADGRVVTGGNSSRQVVRECRLGEEYWQNLVAQAVERQEFLKLDSQVIQDDISRAAQHQIMDAPTSVITLRLADRVHRVEVYASTMMASQARDSVGLQNFVAVEKRLRSLYALAHVGGLEALQPLLDEIQKKLQGQFPDVTQLSAEHLQWTSRDSNDNLRLDFVQELPAVKGKPAQTLGITYIRQQGQVTIEHRLL